MTDSMKALNGVGVGWCEVFLFSLISSRIDKRAGTEEEEVRVAFVVVKVVTSPEGG